MTRLVSVGNVVMDLAIDVPALPERGGDMLATGAATTPGGTFNVLVAARRQGMPGAYAGGHGTGPFGERVRSALEAEGVEVLSARHPSLDTGYAVALTDAGGERTFVTVFGAEGELELGGLELAPADVVYVSGYGLLEATNGTEIADWLDSLGADSLGVDSLGVDSLGPRLVLVDPGPLCADIPPEIATRVAAHTTWLSCNLREAQLLTGHGEPDAAARALLRDWPNVVIRLGPDGCIVATANGTVEFVPGFPVDAIDTNGAGDAHVGAFLAELAAGADPVAAARRANACAALATTRRGPATAPTRDEVDALLA